MPTNFDQLKAHSYVSGFTLRYTNGLKSSLMKPFKDKGEVLLHLELDFDPAADNFVMNARRIFEEFNRPIDEVLIKDDLYVLEYGGRQYDEKIWKINLPASTEGSCRSTEK